MSERGPRVSIIVPSYNQGRFIGETILSCLGQTYPNIEVIVQDGASSDETLGVLTQFDDPRLSCVSEPDRGVVDAVNRALARATGEILAIQSSDDLYLPML
jgi:glycosyltransferase involved in cell wall biosynthesis